MSSDFRSVLTCFRIALDCFGAILQWIYRHISTTTGGLISEEITSGPLHTRAQQSPDVRNHGHA